MKQRVATTLALATWLLGCGLAPEPPPSGEPIQLSNFPESCYDQWAEGLLVTDGTYATAIRVVPGAISPSVPPPAVWPSADIGASVVLPVRWRTGFTALRLAGGEVAVLDPAGKHVATTGRKYKLKGGWLLEASTGGPDFGSPPRVTQFVACGDARSVIASWP